MVALALGLLVLFSAVGTFVGLYACSILGLGFGFGNLARDFAKCLFLSAIAVLSGAGLYWAAHDPRVFMILPVIWVIGLRLAWLDLERPEIVITGLSTILFAALMTFLLVATLT